MTSRQAGTHAGTLGDRDSWVQDGAALREALLRRVPAKIDIGPIYNVDPQRRAAYAGKARHGPLHVGTLGGWQVLPRTPGRPASASWPLTWQMQGPHST